MNELENFKFMFHMSSVINCIADKRKDQITTENSAPKNAKRKHIEQKSKQRKQENVVATASK